MHRGGPDDHYDINQFDFGGGSRVRRETPLRNYEQLNLFTQASEVEVEAEQPVILTIVHTGNPDNKCTGIWVGMPFPEGWRWVDHIYDMELVAEELPPGGFSRFDEQDEPDVWVDLREDDETEEEPEVEDQEKPDDGEEQAEDDKGS